MDNSREFISLALASWAEEQGVALELIKPATPTQNSYIKHFNRTYHDEILNMYVFRNLTEVRELTEKWTNAYNDERPHDSLNDLTPWEYLANTTSWKTLVSGATKRGSFTIQGLSLWRFSSDFCIYGMSGIGRLILIYLGRTYVLPMRLFERPKMSISTPIAGR